ncbi:MAG: hypothetical protein JXB35_08850 [Anaerolineae bacterium]|nr:hypothetical protein [Anaerolineae bacterium]
MMDWTQDYVELGEPLLESQIQYLEEALARTLAPVRPCADFVDALERRLTAMARRRYRNARPLTLVGASLAGGFLVWYLWRRQLEGRTGEDTQPLLFFPRLANRQARRPLV